MKPIKLIVALLLLGLAGVGYAWADHGRSHGHIGIMIGPYWGPGYYSPYPYYYPPVVIERQVPQVYIEQAPSTPPVAAATAPSNYWYYCVATRSYYPYVSECPGGWQKVSPQPPSQP